MKHRRNRHHAPAHAAPAPSPAPDRAHWTPARQRIFLRELLETGSVARAAAAAGMSRSSAHRLRRRLAGTTFDRGWEGAVALFRARLLDPYGLERSTPASRDGFGDD